MGWREKAEEIQAQKLPTNTAPEEIAQSPEISAGGWREKADVIVAQKQKEGAEDELETSPYPQQPREGIINKTVDFFTGRDRETRATEELPSLADVGLDYMLGENFPSLKKAAISSALLTTFDPEEAIQIIDANTDDPVSVAEDEAGNRILNVGGRLAVMNKPGFSKMDALQLGGVTSAFTFGGGLANGGAQTLGKSALKQAVAAGGMQSALEGAQEYSGGDFSGVDVAATSVGAGTIQVLGQVLAPYIPLLREKVSSSGVTKKLREQIDGLLTKQGLNPADVTDDMVTQILQETGGSAKAKEVVARAGEKEFGIPLTDAQRTLDDKSLSFEDSARAGGLGDSPQKTMRDFEKNEQVPAINKARDKIVEEMTGEAAEEAAGDLINEGVRIAEQAADEQVAEAYSNVGKATLTAEGVHKLLNSVRKSVIGSDKDRGLKSTSSMLDEVNNLQKRMVKLEQAGLNLTKLDISRIDNMRKRVNTAVASAENNADRAQVMQMKRAFDDYLDAAVIDGLFSGEAGALQNLKHARNLFSDYAKMFRIDSGRSKSGKVLRDHEGSFIEKIVSANPTAEETVNAVFGAAGFSKMSGARMARKFKSILGEDSAGWQSLRREAIGRLIKTGKVNGEDIVSGTQTQKAIDQAFEKNPTLMNELFSREEAELLKRFAAQVKRTQPDLVKSRENPSNSGIKVNRLLSKALGDTTQKIAAALAISGEPAMLAATTGGRVLSKIGAANKAQNAVKPFASVTKIKPSVQGVATGAVDKGLDEQEKQSRQSEVDAGANESRHLSK